MTERDATLEIDDLHASVDGKDILRGVTLTVRQGETHALMGPNGSGKSTLAGIIMGRPGYEITGGDVRYGGESGLRLSPDERARRGLFLAFQYPVEVPGVSVVNFLRSAYNALHPAEGDGKGMSALAFRKLMKEKMSLVGVDDDMVRRYVNQGFSGGEKKRMETLQLAVLEPRIAILDETDSGLDIDALKAVANGIEQLRGPDLGLLLITHYQRILNYVTPDHVHVLMAGRIVRSGGAELAHELEEKGYEGMRTEVGVVGGA
ncbi:MAG TPA: Fe-S cluster assembly ATPase SufC, partial [Actinomycetota bacterium]|nr:Fe-S cluster assembly ATPase SufC [Actinomycetota bacterium]